jgi:hypothetical protein
MVFGTSANTRCLSAALETLGAVIGAQDPGCGKRPIFIGLQEAGAPWHTVVEFRTPARLVQSLNPQAVSDIKFDHSRRNSLRKKSIETAKILHADKHPLPVRIDAE